MEKKEKCMGNVTFNGSVTFNGPMFDIHDNQHVHIYHKGESEQKKEEEPDLQASEMLTVDERVRKAVLTLKSEGVLRHLYDYTWLMVVMNQTEGLPSFDTPQSFVTYLEGLQLADLPEVSSVKKAYGNVLGDFPNWTFPDRDSKTLPEYLPEGVVFPNSFPNSFFYSPILSRHVFSYVPGIFLSLTLHCRKDKSPETSAH